MRSSHNADFIAVLLVLVGVEPLAVLLPDRQGMFFPVYHRLLLASEQYHRKQEIATGKNGIFAGK